MEYTIPPFLKKGDTIRIIAPAGCVGERPVRFAEKALTEQGFAVEIGKYVFEGYHQFAATDTHRANDLQEALDDPRVKAILCARGGYGSVRILDNVDWTGFARSPKWICGYSDITALHARCAKLNISSLHSTMPVNFEANTVDAIHSLVNALSGNPNTYSWQNSGQKKIELDGLLLGGNLSMLYSLLGSKDQISYKHSILFLEDLNEYLYHIDRMLVALKRAGVFSGIKGLLVGDITVKQNETPYGIPLIDVLKDSLGNCPIITGIPSGHISDNRCLIFGKNANIRIEDDWCTFSQ